MEEISDKMPHGGDAIGRNFNELQRVDSYNSYPIIELTSGKIVNGALKFLKNGKNVDLGFNFTADPKGGAQAFKAWLKINGGGNLIPANSDTYIMVTDLNGKIMPLSFSISGNDLIINTLGVAATAGIQQIGSLTYLIN